MNMWFCKIYRKSIIFYKTYWKVLISTRDESCYWALRFFLNWETLIPCAGNNIRYDAVKLSFYRSRCFFNRTHTALVVSLSGVFWVFALWTKVRKKYFIFYKLTRSPSSNSELLVIVWTLSRVSKLYCLNILLWERRKKWFALNEAAVIVSSVSSACILISTSSKYCNVRYLNN